MIVSREIFLFSFLEEAIRCNCSIKLLGAVLPSNKWDLQGKLSYQSVTRLLLMPELELCSDALIKEIVKVFYVISRKSVPVAGNLCKRGSEKVIYALISDVHYDKEVRKELFCSFIHCYLLFYFCCVYMVIRKKDKCCLLLLKDQMMFFSVFFIIKRNLVLT